jgi:hypothetical protein
MGAGSSFSCGALEHRQPVPGGDQFAAAQPAVAATSVSTNPARMMATRA